MTEAVFFDVGSTLIRPCPSVAETFARVAAERGHDLTVRDVEPHMPAMDAYYEAEYLRDGDFWCSHEGSTAIWLDQYATCAISRASATMRKAWRRRCTSLSARGMLGDVRRRHSVPESAQGAWIRAGSGIELGCGLGRALARPQAAAVLRHGSIFGGGGLPQAEPGHLQPGLRADGRARRIERACGRSPDADGDGAAAAGIRAVIVDRHDAEKDCGYERVTALTDLLELL